MTKPEDEKAGNQLMVIIGAAVVLAIVFYLFLRIGQEISTRSLGVNSKNNTTASQAVKSNKQSSEDQQRKGDVFKMNSALKTYFLSQKKAPDSFDALVPNILSVVPVDPQTKGVYSYQVTKDGQSWKVWALLSDGSKFEAKGP